MGKTGPLLDEVVADQPEAFLLREHDGLVVDRAILEVEDHAGRDPIAPGGLNQVSICQGGAVLRAQDEKAASHPFRMADGHLFGAESPGREQARQDEENLKKTPLHQHLSQSSREQLPYRAISSASGRRSSAPVKEEPDWDRRAGGRIAQNTAPPRTYGNEGTHVHPNW